LGKGKGANRSLIRSEKEWLVRDERKTARSFFMREGKGAALFNLEKNIRPGWASSLAGERRGASRSLSQSQPHGRGSFFTSEKGGVPILSFANERRCLFRGRKKNSLLQLRKGASIFYRSLKGSPSTFGQPMAGEKEFNLGRRNHLSTHREGKGELFPR